MIDSRSCALRENSSLRRLVAIDVTAITPPIRGGGPMQFPCQVHQQSTGLWHVRHQGKDLGEVEVTAINRDEAMEKMRRELRYRLEICPCTGELYDSVAIELIVQQ
jgi:hypothetical protein